MSSEGHESARGVTPVEQSEADWFVVTVLSEAAPSDSRLNLIESDFLVRAGSEANAAEMALALAEAQAQHALGVARITRFGKKAPGHGAGLSQRQLSVAGRAEAEALLAGRATPVTVMPTPLSWGR